MKRDLTERAPRLVNYVRDLTQNEQQGRRVGGEWSVRLTSSLGVCL